MEQDLVAILWSIAGFVLFVSVTASFAEMLFGARAVPARVRELNERHGWPGHAGLRARGWARLSVVVLGMSLLALVAYGCIDGLFDPTIKRTMVGTLALSAQLMASVAWIGVLLYGARGRAGRAP